MTTDEIRAQLIATRKELDDQMHRIDRALEALRPNNVKPLAPSTGRRPGRPRKAA